jgi:hypothetical protein
MWAKKYCAADIAEINNENKSNNERKNIVKRLLNTQKLLSGASTGLTKLAATYGEDVLNNSVIEEYKSGVDTFCNQDLEETISRINQLAIVDQR